MISLYVISEHPMSPPFHSLQFRFFMMKNSCTSFFILKTILHLYIFFYRILFFLFFFLPANLVFFPFHHLHGSQLSPLQSLSNDHKSPLGSYLSLHYLYSDRMIHSFKKIINGLLVKTHSSLTLRNSNLLVEKSI